MAARSSFGTTVRRRPRRSQIPRGNGSDLGLLTEAPRRLEGYPHELAAGPTVVMAAGLSTVENLARLKSPSVTKEARGRCRQ